MFVLYQVQDMQFPVPIVYKIKHLSIRDVCICQIFNLAHRHAYYLDILLHRAQ